MDFPTFYQKWRKKAIKEGYPLCASCGEPIQKEYQKLGTECRQCTNEKKQAEEHARRERLPDWSEYGGTDAVEYERGGR
jgi:RNA polymerase-binding transcription factor DksA